MTIRGWDLERVDELLVKHNCERFEPMGRGLRTTVYRCHDYSRDRELALKLWDPGGPGDPHDETARRFWERQAQLARLPRTSNLLTIRKLVPKAGFLLSDLMTRDLRPRLGEGPMDPDRARLILLTVLQGLVFLHEKAQLLHGAI